MPSEQAAPQMGHNRPTIAELFADQIERLPHYLRDMSADLRTRSRALEADVEAFPTTISEEPVAEEAADLIKNINNSRKTAKAMHAECKAPILEAGRIVEGHFKRGIVFRLDELTAQIKRPLTIYLDAKETAERRRRDAIAETERRNAEAARLEAEETATEARNEVDLKAALAHETTAKKATAKSARATRQAAAPAAELSRTTSEAGTVASLATTWTYEGIDREALDLETLRPHFTEKALESAVAAFVLAGGQQLDGVERIFEQHDTRTR